VAGPNNLSGSEFRPEKRERREGKKREKKKGKKGEEELGFSSSFFSFRIRFECAIGEKLASTRHPEIVERGSGNRCEIG